MRDPALYECRGEMCESSKGQWVHRADHAAAIGKKDDEISRWVARCMAQSIELERWRHGATIEGDFVCPNEYDVKLRDDEIERLGILVEKTIAERDDAVATLAGYEARGEGRCNGCADRSGRIAAEERVAEIEDVISELVSFKALPPTGEHYDEVNARARRALAGREDW